jgi:hypothetical protein
MMMMTCEASVKVTRKAVDLVRVCILIGWGVRCGRDTRAETDLNCDVAKTGEFVIENGRAPGMVRSTLRLVPATVGKRR